MMLIPQKRRFVANDSYSSEKEVCCEWFLFLRKGGLLRMILIPQKRRFVANDSYSSEKEVCCDTWVACSRAGWPHTLENRENGEKKNLKFCWKSGKNQGISKNLILVRSEYSNFIAVQMWLLVVSVCHMLEIPADLILLKGGVLVSWSNSLLYILFFSFSHSEVDTLLQT